MPEEAELNINGRYLDSRYKAKKGQMGYLIPVRLVAENMGALVNWLPERGALVLTYKGTECEFNVGSTLVQVNGKRQNLTELVRAYNGHAFAPVDFVAQAIGASVYYSEDTATLFLVRQEPAFIGKKILLDPGHGGEDWGATNNDVKEKDLSLDIVNRVAQILNRAGLSLYFTRQDDTSINEKERAQIIRNLRADLLVSVHINSSVQSMLAGVEAYFYASWQGQRLAGELISEVVTETKAVNRGVKEGAFYLLRHSFSPAALISCGFLTNLGEFTKLNSSKYREKIAVGLYRGIRAYLETQFLSKSH